jgi:hypothetical protein
MDAFVICARIVEADHCQCCDAPSTWSLHVSSNPNRKYGACEDHLDTVRELIARSGPKGEVRSRGECALV